VGVWAGKVRKAFFFEKKNQKTSIPFGARVQGKPTHTREPKGIKVFCFFFSKKKAFLASLESSPC
jgi:hypothetical protein